MEVNPILLDAIFTDELLVISPATTVIIDQPWETITAAEKILLEKILVAIKQSLNSVTLIYQSSLDLARLAEKPRQVIYFGKSIKGIPIYEGVEANGVAVVASENLCDLSKNEEARKKLWQALKKQFL